MPADLSVLLRDAADTEPVPELDLERVATTARRRIGRRRSRLAGAALTAVAVVMTVAVVRGDDRSVSTSATSSTTAGAPQEVLRPYRVPTLDQRVVVGGDGVLQAMRTYDGSSSGFAWGRVEARTMVRVGDSVVWSDTRSAWVTPVGSTDAAQIGKANAVIPALHPDRVWLVRGDDAMQEVWADGSVARELVLPVGATPVREVIDGMLVDAGGRIALVRADGTVEHLSGVGPPIAASATRILGQQASIIDAATGEISPLSVPGIRVDEVVAAAFSHDGSMLAVITGPLGTRRALLHIVEVTPMALIERHRVQSVGRPRALEWSPLGEAVYLLDDDPVLPLTRRILGLPIGGALETVATIDQPVRIDALAVFERP